ncbi:B3 domain-containing protein At2g33720-like [Syzygium oleosum]|uniref:B3 domain-containing protein At2g33720-like n=1 Tax=Syzygium oleosum TaxID=219896 RepID=UPI0011D25D56|nr:B3 domain-containing protein At2g33720-like [Syzygium oleosum]
MSDLFRDEREGAEMYRADVSTRLELYWDPWKIKKRLTESDLGHLSRFLIPRSCVETHVLPQMGPEMVMRVGSGDGMKVAVRDADTGDEYLLVFRYWLSLKSYVLNEGWNRLFVRRRGLQVGDEIGMLWDPGFLKFHFKVLRRVARHDR